MSNRVAILPTDTRNETAGKVRRPEVVRVEVAGATGYVGRELISLLTRHPGAELTRLTSSGRGQKQALPVEQSHPALRGKALCAIQALRLEELVPSEVDLVLLATPHETAHDMVPTLLERGLRVIDLSGAFRLKDSSAYARWYGFEHRAAEALAQAVYGLTELNRENIRKARLVSNPGCYATSVILALAPLLEAGWVDVAAGIVCDAKSGASGAGRAPSEKLQFVEVNENCRAYGLFHHRHVPEMLQALGLEEARLTFTPHLLPVNRGILSTVYLRLAKRWAEDDVVGLFREFYAHAPLVRVYDGGALPEVQAVAHTNYADLGFALDAPTGRLIVVSALDNLGKGAAGQAIQNLNLMFGFPEETALG
jgi:N-acetyl-gamma-glutamyl-phosphate reductase